MASMKLGKLRIIVLISVVKLLLINGLYSQSVYYIDPTNSNSNPNGSLSNPYKSWYQVPWKDNTVYYQKRGTTFNSDKPIVPRAKNVTFDAYGSGNKPKIVGNGDYKLIESYHGSFTIKNFELSSVNRSAICAVSHWYEGELKVDNCLFHSLSWGIRIFLTTGKNVISNTVIHNIWDDGIYTEDNRNIEIFGCHIYNVNMGYFDGPETVAGGDCIQISNDQGYSYIHNNILDRSGAGGKFCLIIGEGESGNDPANAIDSARVENNTFIGSNYNLYPLEGAHNPNATTGIYVKSSIRKLVVKGNRFEKIENGYGVITYAGYPSEFRNNFFEVNTTSIYLAGTSNSVLIDRNEFRNNSSESIIRVGASTVHSTYNTFYVDPSTEHVYFIYSNGTLTEQNNTYLDNDLQYTLPGTCMLLNNSFTSAGHRILPGHHLSEWLSSPGR